MLFKEFLSESTITDIANAEKVFVLVIGGSASGKNYWYERHFKFPLVDIDAITKKLSGADFEKARKMTAKALSIAGKQLEASFKNGQSIAQVTTGAGAKGVENKLKKAKSFGFKTALILVDTDVETAIKRNHKRANDGKQGLIPDWKVEKTNLNARETYKNLKRVVDYATEVK